METTSMHETGLMAAWIATGGAGDAMRETAGEDDGLAANWPTRQFYTCGDDGLALTSTIAWQCFRDERLQAGHHTGFGCLL